MAMPMSISTLPQLQMGLPTTLQRIHLLLLLSPALVLRICLSLRSRAVPSI